MHMEQTPSQQQVHWRIPADVHAALGEYAKRTRRSRNGAAVHLLERGLTATESRPTSWGAEADSRWDIFRTAVQNGAPADEAAELAGIERIRATDADR